MAITLVGVGSPAVASGLSPALSPSPHGSTVNGNVMFFGFMGTVNPAEPTITGWNKVYYFTGTTPPRCLGLYWRVANGAGDDTPSVTLAQAGSGNVRIGQIASFDGVDTSDPIDVVSAAVTASMSGITAISPTAVNGAIIVHGGTSDGSWTSVATLSGDSLTWGELGEPDTGTGNDVGMVWDWAPWTGGAPTITDKTFSVTGGSGTGLGAMVSLNAAAVVTTGTIAASLRPLTAALSGRMQPEGTIAASLQPLTIAISGTQAGSTGTIAASLQRLTIAASGSHGQAGTIAASLRPLTALLSGVMHPSGTIAASLQPLSASLAGTHGQSGTIAAALRPLTAALSGTHGQTGTIAASLRPLTALLSGVMHPSGTIASALQPLTAAASGSQRQTGTIAASLQPLTAALAGVHGAYTGTIAAALQPLSAALTGAMQPDGVIAASLQPVRAALTGIMHPSGTIAASLQPLTAAASGISLEPLTGTIAAALQPLRAALTGSLPEILPFPRKAGGYAAVGRVRAAASAAAKSIRRL